MAGLSRRLGTTRAMKINGKVKSSGRSAGITCPTNMPRAELICQQVHRVIPAPRKYQCLCLLSRDSSK